MSWAKIVIPHITDKRLQSRKYEEFLQILEKRTRWKFKNDGRPRGRCAVTQSLWSGAWTCLREARRRPGAGPSDRPRSSPGGQTPASAMKRRVWGWTRRSLGPAAQDCVSALSLLLKSLTDKLDSSAWSLGLWLLLCWGPLCVYETRGWGQGR